MPYVVDLVILKIFISTMTMKADLYVGYFALPVIMVWACFKITHSGLSVRSGISSEMEKGKRRAAHP